MPGLVSRDGRPLEVLAVIPARGGSKGLPRKNILPLGGRPLVTHSISAALRTGAVTRVIVSTEDEEIAEVALSHGAEVPWLRPARLAGDRADTGQVMNHLLKTLARKEGYRPDLVLELYPTSPFRNPAVLHMLCVTALTGYRWGVTVAPVRYSPANHFVPDSEGRLHSLQPWGKGGDWATPLYRQYAMATLTNLMRRTRPEVFRYVIDNPVEQIDIDYPEDLALAESVLALGLYRTTG